MAKDGAMRPNIRLPPLPYGVFAGKPLNAIRWRTILINSKRRNP